MRPPKTKWSGGPEVWSRPKENKGDLEVRRSGCLEVQRLPKEKQTNKQKKVQRSAGPEVRMSGGLEAPMKKIIPAKHPNSGT